MDEPAVERHRRAGRRAAACPILIHAGRGIPALGRLTVELAEAHPGATLILAHAAISDLAWLWRVLPDHPNVLIDTAWWHPSDLLAMFALAPPANLVWASDSPYGRPLISAAIALRCARAGGARPDAAARHRRRDDRARARPARRRRTSARRRDRRAEPLDLLLERVVAHLGGAFNRLVGGRRPGRAARARPAGLRGRRRRPAAPSCSPAVLGLMDAYEAGTDERVPGRPFPPSVRYLIAAITVARTPDVPGCPSRRRAGAHARRGGGVGLAAADPAHHGAGALARGALRRRRASRCRRSRGTRRRRRPPRAAAPRRRAPCPDRAVSCGRSRPSGTRLVCRESRGRVE